jgi:hypothetical protein
MTKQTQSYREPTEEEIALYAYYLWEFEGRPHGRDVEYWLEAKAHLTADRQYEAGVLQKVKTQPSPPNDQGIPRATPQAPRRPRTTKKKQEPNPDDHVLV